MAILIWLYCPSCIHDGQKLFLGLGYIDIKKLDQEMHRFQINKIVEKTDGLEKGRLYLKRRRTILRGKYFASSDSV